MALAHCYPAPMHVLVVDDNAGVREALQLLFTTTIWRFALRALLPRHCASPGTARRRWSSRT